MKSQAIYLKVKLKSLAAEARIIRFEEARKPMWRNGLREHRVGIVREEARATMLAYGFIRGRSYASIEPGSKTAPNWDKVRAMVKRYGIDGRDMTTNQAHSVRQAQLVAFEAWIPVDKPVEVC